DHYCKMTRTELIIQLLKVAIGLAFGAYFVWWSLQVLELNTMHGPLWLPARHEGPPPRQSGVRGVDPRLRATRRPHANAWLRADARGRDGGVREGVAERVKDMGRPADGSIQNISSLPQGPSGASGAS